MINFVSGLFFPKWILYLIIGGAVAISIFAIYRKGESHGKLKVERELSSELRKGKKKVKAKVEKHKTQDKKILQEVREMEKPPPGTILTPEKKLEIKKKKFDKLKDIGSY